MYIYIYTYIYIYGYIDYIDIHMISGTCRCHILAHSVYWKHGVYTSHLLEITHVYLSKPYHFESKRLVHVPISVDVVRVGSPKSELQQSHGAVLTVGVFENISFVT